MRKIAGALIVIACAGCGDDGGKGAAKDAAIDSKIAIDARPIDAPGIDAPMIDAPPGTFPLKVKNYANWCQVSVNGGASSIAAEQNVFVLPGNIPLIATAATGFIVSGNIWHDTMLDTGAGEPGEITTPAGVTTSKAYAVVVASAKCAWVCCPFPNGTGCEEAVIGDQCP